MIVIVESVESMGSIAQGTGYNDAGDRVVFAGDWRPMRDIAIALAEGENEVQVDVADWQVLSVLRGRQ